MTAWFTGARKIKLSRCLVASTEPIRRRARASARVAAAARQGTSRATASGPR